METRELRYFIAVAEESHVGRAAQRLGMAQPPLSRAIAQLERRMGASLFVRSPRGMTLTTAGQTLLREGRAALAAVEAAERRTRRTIAAAGRASVVLTAKAGASSELMAKLLDAYAAEPDAVDVEVVLSPPGHQAPMLRDGRADVAILHQPFDDVSGFDVDTLRVEDQVLILPAGHPAEPRDLADRRRGDVDPRPSPAALASARRHLPRRAGSRDARPDPGAAARAARPRRDRAAGVGARQRAATGWRSYRSPTPPQVTTVIAWPPQSTSPGVAGLVRTASRLSGAPHD